MLLKAIKSPEEYLAARKYFEAKQYSDAIALFDKIIKKGTKDAEIYRMAVSAYIQMKDYQTADAIQKEQVSKIGNLNSIDRANMALLKTLLGNHEEAIGYYKHLLQSGETNKYNLNNLGYTLTLVGKYDEAIFYLDKVISMDGEFAYAYCNLGYAKMKAGKLEEGKKDNDRSLELDSDNAHGYRNEGIYLCEKGQYERALTSLNKAKEMDPDLLFVAEYIDRVSKQLEANNNRVNN